MPDSDSVFSGGSFAVARGYERRRFFGGGLRVAGSVRVAALRFPELNTLTGTET